MRHSDRDQIRALPLFRDMSADHFEELMSAACLHRFPHGVTLITEGDIPDFLHVLVDGTVELFGHTGEREATLDIIRPLATFVLAAVIREEAYLKSARTLGTARVLMLPAETVREVLGRDAAFACAILNELALRYRTVVRALKDHKLRSAADRLANWILELDRQQNRGGTVVLDYDKRTLASRLGMTPENLSRNLATLAAHGVSTVGREIIITDREALQRRAKPNPLIDGQ